VFDNPYYDKLFFITIAILLVLAIAVLTHFFVMGRKPRVPKERQKLHITERLALAKRYHNLSLGEAWDHSELLERIAIRDALDEAKVPVYHDELESGQFFFLAGYNTARRNHGLNLETDYITKH